MRLLELKCVMVMLHLCVLNIQGRGAKIKVHLLTFVIFIFSITLSSCEQPKEKVGSITEQLEKIKSEQIIPWGIELVGYQTSTSNAPIKVAILDSGIHKSHEDLQGKVSKEYNAINPGQPVEDDYGHGTALAGIVTTNDNN